MNFLQLFRTAYNTIRADKLRTALSMIGIVIGTLTIALVIAIGGGVEEAVQDQFKTLSVNNLFVVPDGEESQLSVDERAIVAESEYVSEVSANMNSKFLVSNSVTDLAESYIIDGVKENYFKLFNLTLQEGKLFEDGDTVERVAVIWVDVMKDLLELEKPADAIGGFVTIKSKKFRIIGVLDEIGVSFGPFSYDSTIYVPLGAARRYLIKSNLTSAISAFVKDVEQMDAAEEDIRRLLVDEYNIKGDDNDWFTFINAGATIGIATQVAQVLSFLLVGISIIILIVSGIGIMNVMFAGVAERKKEIGILKSLGATQAQIKKQFLLESVMITLISGLLWILLAELIILLAVSFDAPISRSTMWDLLSLWFALVTWVFSGRYPAARAAKLDPVEALRG